MASSAAPGELETVRNFVNTVEIDAVTDALSAEDTLGQWCTTSGTCPDGIDEDGLSELRRFREALRAVLEANAGEGDAAERWHALEPYAARAGYGMCITPAGLPALRPEGAGADRVIAAVLRIVYDAIGQGTWTRLKACRKHSCRWAFYDKSKNGSGAWCSMRVCGNRVKAERRRAREKSHEIR
jgi:predicted RNA-binding Zn ribbon-like protein